MRKFLVVAVALALLLAACANESPTVSGSPSGSGGTATETSTPTTPATAADCAAQNSDAFVTAGTLAVGTDNPAYPPWYSGDDTKDTNWKINDPATGEGFESAVAYAVADQLGFTTDQVQWVEVPFDQSYAPGAKSFDFDINQISYTAKRAQAVDFSDSYYDVNQSLVALKDTPITGATSLSDLKDYTLATQIGTTSYDYITNVIQPNKEPGAFNKLVDSIQALKNGQVDGIVVDLPTAFYITAVQIPGGVIVGQFPAAGGEQEHFAMAFAKGGPLVTCVNQALDALKADGTLQSIQDQWLSSAVSVPVFATS